MITKQLKEVHKMYIIECYIQIFTNIHIAPQN